MTVTEALPLYRIRVSATVINDLRGSQAWVERHNADSAEHEDDLSLMRKVEEARARKDGGATLFVTREEGEALRLRADWLVDKARDGIGDDPGALGEYNAGRWLLRQIATVLDA